MSLTSGKTLVIPGRGRPTHCLRGDDLVSVIEETPRSLSENMPSLCLGESPSLYMIEVSLVSV